MSFKNELERRCFEIAVRALGGGVTIEHNKTIQIETALFPEVASFKGPPAKEVDVLVAQLLDKPKVVLLVSCKSLSRRAEPTHVQEWGAVVQTMNRYSDGTLYFGLVVSPTGFTSGCEPWATLHNLGIVPPLKGRRLAFDEDTVFRMFERTLVALRARVRLRVDDLTTAPAFFDFVYRLVADFEGHQAYPRYPTALFLSRPWWCGIRIIWRNISDELSEHQRYSRSEEAHVTMVFFSLAPLPFLRICFNHLSRAERSPAYTARERHGSGHRRIRSSNLSTRS